jgi:hypothetical protein
MIIQYPDLLLFMFAFSLLLQSPQAAQALPRNLDNGKEHCT